MTLKNKTLSSVEYGGKKFKECIGAHQDVT